MSRTAAVAVVAITLILLSVPAVHARPIERSGPSIETGSWMDAALSWLSSLFGDQPVSQDQPHSTFDATNTNTTIGGYYQPNSGSCIDPEGSPRCNL
ncbi:MAG TPA: hypothetical protein VH394_27600 [Thermoanaerobaculia bacterium]|nr:hypothetical protein [Thermoanaerobaculia bacterium]